MESTRRAWLEGKRRLVISKAEGGGSRAAPDSSHEWLVRKLEGIRAVAASRDVPSRAAPAELDEQAAVLLSRLRARGMLLPNDESPCCTQHERAVLQQRLQILQHAEAVRRRQGAIEFERAQSGREEHASAMLFASLLPTSARFERTSPASVWPSVPTTRAAVLENTSRVLAACARVLGQRTAEDLDESTEVYETELDSLHRLLGASAKARQTASAAGLDGSSGDADEGSPETTIVDAAHFAQQSLHSSRAALALADRVLQV